MSVHVADRPVVKERPILFSGSMVQAILAGAKTQTRRILKTPTIVLPRAVYGDFHWATTMAPAGKYVAEMNPHGALSVRASNGSMLGVKPGEFVWDAPYGSVGDRLWVRESFTLGEIPTTVQGAEQLKRGPIIDPDARSTWQHAAWYDGTDHPGGWFTKVKRTPSIHMPRWASRLTLEITEIRVERLAAITHADARAEGMQVVETDRIGDLYGLPGRPEFNTRTSLGSFGRLWASINGQESWGQNPFVWAVSFKVVLA